MRRELADIAEHQRRTDRLLMELQIEARRQHRDITGKLDEIKHGLQRLLSNGGSESAHG
jgi:hypothetical protein